MSDERMSEFPFLLTRSETRLDINLEVFQVSAWEMALYSGLGAGQPLHIFAKHLKFKNLQTLLTQIPSSYTFVNVKHMSDIVCDAQVFHQTLAPCKSQKW